MVDINENEQAFDRLIQANRPAAPSTPSGEWNLLVEQVAPRPWLGQWALGVGVAAALAVAVLLPKTTQEPATELAQAPVEAMLQEAASEMSDPTTGLEDGFDLYATL